MTSDDGMVVLGIDLGEGYTNLLAWYRSSTNLQRSTVRR
jgi:hypothetical protein